MSLPPSLPPPSTNAPRSILTQPNILSVPFQLRANDVKIHVVNIDSRFRQRPTNATNESTEIVATEKSQASDFYYSVSPPIKNVLRIRVTSIEFPNNYPFFTEKRHNTTLRILYEDGGLGQSAVITIPDGNYTAEDMTTTLTNIFADVVYGLTWLSVAFDSISGGFTFSGTKRFAIDAPYDSYKRPFDYGLAYYLGFTRTVHKASKPCTTVPNCWEISSDMCANFAGDPYLLLRVNDYSCVRHSTTENSFTALAKIVLREPKNYMTFDDYASQHAKEVVFPAPQNISRLHIQVLDPYGEPIDMCSSNFSFSLEILEIRNSSLYNTILGSIGSHYF